MPSAGRDAELTGRFVADWDATLDAAGLPPDAPVGVALSGGPDSAALLILAARHARMSIRALTVDHGLRPEAVAEAADAAALCVTFGVPHETVRVTLTSGSVQAAARSARYTAFGDWAAREGLAAVATAHHADDQAETVLMRLARGAGVAGLSGVRATQTYRRHPGESHGPAQPVPTLATPKSGGSRNDDGLVVVRPLLGWRKADLEYVCTSAGVAPARDPSNHDPAYDRTAARALLAATPWLDPARLAAAAAHLAEAEAALAAVADERYRIEDGDAVGLRPDPLREIARRHVLRLLAERFGAYPDGPSLDRTMAVLAAGGQATCADVLCRADGPVWRFRRAPPRRGA